MLTIRNECLTVTLTLNTTFKLGDGHFVPIKAVDLHKYSYMLVLSSQRCLNRCTHTHTSERCLQCRLSSDGSGSSNQRLRVLLSDQMMCSYFLTYIKKVACLLLMESN